MFFAAVIENEYKLCSFAVYYSLNIAYYW